ncbi:MAG TPA: prohibitin family protein [Candidatus Dojkabacteria bacterium]|nr:prohibitin family protein [Candidatus Dojkabacteria bacterium]HQF36113.1 prohibitin family protein [Candidatus Dojkabacteria bacterium]
MVNPKKSVGLIFLGVVAAVFLLTIIFDSFTTISSGTVGVVRRFGEVKRVIYPGINFKLPLLEDVIVYNTQRVIYETSAYPTESNADYTDYPVDTTTKDGQPISIKYSIRFSIDPNKAEWLANNLGNEAEIVEKIVKTDSRIYVRGIAREYEAGDLYTGNIVAVQDAISEVLVESFEKNGLILDDFGIRNIDFSPDYVAVIEQKQREKEKVTTEKYIAEQEQYKKQAAITKAEAEAESQKLLQTTITQQILMKMWIEKWNGQLPQVVTGEGQDYILNMGDL